MTRMRKPASGTASIQVINRAAEILRILAVTPSGLSLGELADRTGLARSTVQRIVKALADEQFLIPASKRAGVRLGPGLIPLAQAAQQDIALVAQPLLNELSEITQETVDMSILSGPNALFIAQASGNARLSASSSIGDAFPLYCTANGKALLSCVPKTQQIKLVPEPIPALTEHTLDDPTEVFAQARLARSTGLAYDFEEHTEDVCAIATAFIDAHGRPHALSIPMPKSRFERSRSKIEANLLAYRDRLIGILGGSLP